MYNLLIIDNDWKADDTKLLSINGLNIVKNLPSIVENEIKYIVSKFDIDATLVRFNKFDGSTILVLEEIKLYEIPVFLLIDETTNREFYEYSNYFDGLINKPITQYGIEQLKFLIHKKIVFSQTYLRVAEQMNFLFEIEDNKDNLSGLFNFFYSLINNSSVWISVRNKDGDYILWNKAAEKITGYKAVEVLGHNEIIDKLYYDKKYRAVAEEKIQHAIKHGLSEGFEIEIKNRAGERRTISLYTRGIFSDNKRYLGHLSIAYDITNKKLEEANRLLEKERETIAKLLDFNPYPIMLLDPEGYFVSWNKAFESFAGNFAPPKGFTFFEDPALKASGVVTKMKDVLKGEPVMLNEYWYDYSILEKSGIDVSGFKNARGMDKICLKTILFPLLSDEPNKIEKIIVMHEDITKQKIAEDKIKASLEKKELLLKEINHRIKNNLQIIISLLSLQSSNIKDKKVIGMFSETQNRIKSMALIHENLYQSGNMDAVDLDVYLKNLSQNLLNTFRTDISRVKLKLKLESVAVDMKMAISIGLIVNELISNSLKYAFPKDSKGEISIVLKNIKDNSFELIIKDNGVGIADNERIKESNTLGMQLIFSLSEQINSKIDYTTNNGVSFTFVIPIP